MSSEQYEHMRGTNEQIEVFMDLQRMLLRMFNKWDGDTSVAVFGAALGCAVALIETQYKQHLEECPTCKDSVDPGVLELADTARANFEHYYNKIYDDEESCKEVAKELVDAFFKGVKRD
jgi:hypothetical protein